MGLEEIYLNSLSPQISKKKWLKIRAEKKVGNRVDEDMLSRINQQMVTHRIVKA